MGRSVERRRRLKRDLYVQQRGLCAYCNRMMPDAMKATFDHFIPKSKGGTWALRNLRLSCSACNRMKGDLDPRTVDRPAPLSEPMAILAHLLESGKLLDEAMADPSYVRAIAAERSRPFRIGSRP